MTKLCKKCLLEKPYCEFLKRKVYKDGFSSWCKDCHKAYKEENHERLLQLRRERKKKIREEMLAAYGGKCSCCGESTPNFLSLDHIGGGGRKHKREIKGDQIERFLKKNGWPKDKYRLLCFNCNCSIGFYGYCHQKPNEEVKDE